MNQNKEKGFTLIETLIALSILAVATMSIGYALTVMASFSDNRIGDGIAHRATTSAIEALNGYRDFGGLYKNYKKWTSANPFGVTPAGDIQWAVANKNALGTLNGYGSFKFIVNEPSYKWKEWGTGTCFNTNKVNGVDLNGDGDAMDMNLFIGRTIDTPTNGFPTTNSQYHIVLPVVVYITMRNRDGGTGANKWISYERRVWILNNQEK